MSLTFGDALQIFTLVMLGALAADRWIHPRELHEAITGKDLSGILSDLRILTQRMDNASRRSSDREGKVQAAINDLKLDMREVQTRLTIHPRHYEPHDID